MINFKPFSKTPSETLSNSHYFCDYVELLSLINGVDGVSISEVYDRFWEDEKIPNIGSEQSGETNQEWEGRIGNWFEEISARENHYGEHYPFTFSNSRIKRKDNITEIHYLYLLLLLCSSMSYINGYHILTSLFEKVSYYAMRNFLPSYSNVHVFGVSAGGNDRYIGSLSEKYRRLATDLGLTIAQREEAFRVGDNGDGGLDIVAWVPFKEDPNLDRKMIFLGQSAAGKNWTNKQGSVDRTRNYIIDLPYSAQNVLFVPYDFRNYQRLFCQNGEITASLIFDRHRILKLVDSEVLLADPLGENFRAVVDYSLRYIEDII
ncbi:hypothetical protein [Enterobacter hormaechei]|uniref:hypothetical protein n=1 Tax=Enterobacter hormaechei TaxID=158836 RepID=UPI0013638E38|nr:hypothetical protein [Enterobacter hormaechei]QHI59247.1 hypothetical protein GTQ93_18130 [Enterobacter hormaechei]